MEFIRKNIVNKKGFSLLELLIVVGIMAILGTFLSLNLFGLSQRKNIDSDTQKIAYILRSAHDKSVEQDNSSQWGVHFENPNQGKGFFAVFSGSYSSSSVSSRIVLSSNNIFLNPAIGTSLDVTFLKESGLPSTTTSIKIALSTNNNVSSTITILPQGQVQY